MANMHDVYTAVESKMRQTPAGEPHTFIQWKGTDVCLDFHCVCGHHSHWDTDFLYNLRCPKCRKVFRLGSTVQAVEMSEAEAEALGGAKELEPDDDCLSTDQPEGT